MKRQILIITIMLLSAFAIPSEAAKKTRKLYVMAVGVGNYKHPEVQNLNKPVNDADSIAALFSANGAEVLVLKDSLATGESIRSKMREFFAKSTKSDNVLFFFSGHGIQSGFCAHDYGITYQGCVSYKDIKKIFQEIDAYGRMIIADACYSGELRSKPRHKEEVSEDSAQSVVANTTNNKQQVMLYLSSRDNEVSYESIAMPNGYFTYYLCDALRGAADANKNGAITAEELSNYVSFNVKESSNDKQHPVMWGNFNKGWIIYRVPGRE